MPDMNFKLTEAEGSFIISVLDNLPTQSNAWPLVQKLKMQIEAQKQTAVDDPAQQE